jgi:hypothetical protein
MFAKNKVSQSLVDAVNSVVNEAEKVPTSTGMKVYGSSYGNSQKARKDQLKTSIDDVKGPTEKNIYNKSSKDYNHNVKEELKGNQHKIDKNKNKKIDAEDFKMLRKEELKGDQHKIDANKNNKIDAHDFQLLRGKKKVKEDTFVGKLFNSLSESEEIRRAINEVMKRDASAGDWISDFLHSDNPKFDGKSKAERKKMALAAYYSMKKRSRNESVEDLEMTKTSDETEETAARKSIKAKDTEKSQKINNLDVKYGTPNAFDEEVELDEAPREIAQMNKRIQAFKIAKGSIKSASGFDPLKDRGNIKSKTKGTAKTNITLKQNLKHSSHVKPNLPEEVELNEISKSEVDHHYDKWTTSDSAPNHHDAGDDPKIHKSALKYLRSTDVPKENHEKLAMHIANKFHGSSIDEAAPKKMDDVAKQNLTPAKKGVVGTVKSDFKNFKNFLAGKPETNEAVDSSNQTIDTLAGRSKKVPKEAKIDNAHSSAKVALKSEEVESLDEDNYLNKFLSSRGINPKFVTRNTKVAHAKSNEYKTWLKNHKDVDGYKMSEASEVPFDGPYTKTKKDVKDKSGAVHTPMSRAKDLAQQAMKRVKSDLGKKK